MDAGLDKANAWNPAAIKSEKDTFVLDLKANQYYVLKVTLNGTWEGENNIKGYNELTEKADGLDDVSDDHNIGFKLSEAGKVQVIYTIKDNKTIFKLEGKFATGTTPVDPGETVTVYFVNTEDWKTVKAYVWKGETGYKTWPGEAMTKTEDKVNGKDLYSYSFPKEYDKVIFNDGGDNQTADLTWDKDKPYYSDGKWYATKEDIPVPAAPAKFYITGDSALVVDAGLDKANAWNPAAIKSEKDTFELELKADQYYVLKVTLNGTWEGENNIKGYNELTEKADGLDDVSDDHNIGFKLSEAGKVQVIYTIKDNKTIFKLEGKFATGTTPVDPGETVTVYFVNSVNWETINAYVWFGDGDSYKAWPGEAVTKEATPSGAAKRVVANLQGYDIYSYKFPAKYVNIIFNNGSEQTADLTWEADKPYFVPADKNTDGKYEGTWYTKEEITGDIGTDLDAIKAGNQATKIFLNGQLFIIRGTQTYTVMGQTVR